MYDQSRNWLQYCVPAEILVTRVDEKSNESLKTSRIGETNTCRDIHLREWGLVYSPKNKVFEDLLQLASIRFNFTVIYGVNSSEEVERLMIEREFLAGVVFDHSANITELPQNLVYALRFPSELRTETNDKLTAFSWQTNLLYPLLSGGGPRVKTSNEGGDPFYYSDGFLAIQNAIAWSYTINRCIELKTCVGNISIPSIEMQRFPYPPYLNDILLNGLTDAVGLFIMLSFVYPIIGTVRFIAVEREKQLKEVMKIMGMPVWLHWTSWFVRTMIFMIVSITLMIGLLKIPMYDSSVAVFTNSNWFTIWVKVPFIVQLLSCISPNVAMAYGCKSIIEFERSGEGLQWTNFWSYPIIENNFTIGTTISFMLMTSAVFLLIALYVEKVFPGEYGVPEDCNFAFKKEFWFGKESGSKSEECSDNHQEQIIHENFEPEPTDCVAGVRVKNLRKIFDNGKVACKGVTFNMFCDQITVLLGHNGAGKSTTLKILTGMIPPTSGTAIIDEYDIRADLNNARKSIGICPQHDILFDELTVREHIEFYCRLKGLKWSAVDKELRKYVRILNLESKIDTPSHALSGGMQRKLSFIIALCADSKVVLCDEPTSGVDPAARRELWDLLQAEKKGRTIILTTHFMDEADVLADRIAIMADGEVKCCGTTFFLKKRFGDGYRLICAKQEDCVSSEVTRVLREFIPNVELLEEDTEEISYGLPYEQSDKFARMFERLENELDALNLQRFGVSSTELEEVFLKVGSDNRRPSQISNHVSFDIEASKSELLNGFWLHMNQCVIFVRVAQDFNNLPELNISLNRYERTETMVQTPQGNRIDPLINSTFAQYRQRLRENASHTLDEFDEDIQHHFLKLGNEIKVRTNTRHLVGLSYHNHSFIAWFNNQLFHTAPLSLNLLHNALLRSKLGDGYSIQVSNNPIPFRPESKIVLTMNGNDMGSQLAKYISFAMAFTMALYIMFYIRERASKAKLLQFISGVDASTFWVISFLFDFATYILTSAVFYVTVMSFQEEYWSTASELGPLIAVLTTFGLSSFAITFVASFLFSNASYGFVALAITFVFTGTSFFKLITIMLLPILDLTKMADGLKWIFLAFPHYALGYSLFNMNQFRIKADVWHLECERLKNLLSSNNTHLLASTNGTLNISDVSQNATCDPTEYDENIYDWDEPGIGRSLTYMTITAIVFFIILWMIECRIISTIRHYIRRPSSQPSPLLLVSNAIDGDVINEKNKVNAMTRENLQAHNLVLQNLTKFYGDFLAVKGISVAVKRSECFGLLGINGAGKTTTFKMITGDAPISSGDVFVNGLSLKTHLAEVHKMIGYCPQFDALLDNLTGSQTLEIFGLLRGYRRKDISAMSARLASNLNFTKHIDKEIKSYSG
ncbi:phospholipid-transporting ATPase ABCA3-like, partial [Sitodiplosis mosellana]|uniref:phospholipid-transporting ATPase ABCA3-like n=1 Tax=Sitodiplosis mosellana TaxID=263140 RepID=UPI002444372F